MMILILLSLSLFLSLSLSLLTRLGATLLGTTDRAGSPSSSPSPPEKEIEWILCEASKYLAPELKARREDVLSAWTGWRPLAVDPYARTRSVSLSLSLSLALKNQRARTPKKGARK